MPQAILLKDVEGLGEAGSVVDVSPGYLRNYLAPKKLAQAATDASVAAARRRSASAPRRRPASRRSGPGDGRAALARRCSRSRTAPVRTAACSAPSPQRRSPTRSARRAGLKIDQRKVRLEQPIRELGTHMVEIEVAPGVMTAVKTMVVEQPSARQGPTPALHRASWR